MYSIQFSSCLSQESKLIFIILSWMTAEISYKFHGFLFSADLLKLSFFSFKHSKHNYFIADCSNFLTSFIIIFLLLHNELLQI